MAVEDDIAGLRAELSETRAELDRLVAFADRQQTTIERTDRLLFGALELIVSMVGASQATMIEMRARAAAQKLDTAPIDSILSTMGQALDTLRKTVKGTTTVAK